PASWAPSGASVGSGTGWDPVDCGTAAGGAIGSVSATGAVSGSVWTISAMAHFSSARTSRPTIHGQIDGLLRSTLMSAIRAYLLAHGSDSAGSAATRPRHV